MSKGAPFWATSGRSFFGLCFGHPFLHSTALPAPRALAPDYVWQLLHLAHIVKARASGRRQRHRMEERMPKAQAKKRRPEVAQSEIGLGLRAGDPSPSSSSELKLELRARARAPSSSSVLELGLGARAPARSSSSEPEPELRARARARSSSSELELGARAPSSRAHKRG